MPGLEGHNIANTKRYKVGIVIGKFDPFHKGHEFLIQTATKACNFVHVFIVDSKNDHFPVTLRQSWIDQSSVGGNFSTTIVKDIYDDDNSEAWANHTLDYVHGCTFKHYINEADMAVFGSEDYINTYARHMNIASVIVDKDRTNFPISASALFADPIENWQYVPTMVRPSLVRKILVHGAESSGTTTLARELAKELGCPYVPEYGRWYCDSILDLKHYEWTPKDFKKIAESQNNIEHDSAYLSDNGYIVCDTDATSTYVFTEFYAPKHNFKKEDFVPAIKTWFTIITDYDIPFVQDGSRNESIDRWKMQKRFLQESSVLGTDYYMISIGNHQQRINEALSRIRYFRRNTKTQFIPYYLPDPADHLLDPALEYAEMMFSNKKDYNRQRVRELAEHFDHLFND